MAKYSDRKRARLAGVFIPEPGNRPYTWEKERRISRRYRENQAVPGVETRYTITAITPAGAATAIGNRAGEGGYAEFLVWRASRERHPDGTPRFSAFVAADTSGNSRSVEPEGVENFPGLLDRFLNFKKDYTAETLSLAIGNIEKILAAIREARAKPGVINAQLEEMNAKIAEAESADGDAMEVASRTATMQQARDILTRRMEAAILARGPKVDELNAELDRSLCRLNEICVLAAAQLENAEHARAAEALLSPLRMIEPNLTADDSAVRAITGRFCDCDPPAFWGSQWTPYFGAPDRRELQVILFRARETLTAMEAGGKDGPYSAKALAKWGEIKTSAATPPPANAGKPYRLPAEVALKDDIQKMRRDGVEAAEIHRFALQTYPALMGAAK